MLQQYASSLDVSNALIDLQSSLSATERQLTYAQWFHVLRFDPQGVLAASNYVLEGRMGPGPIAFAGHLLESCSAERVDPIAPFLTLVAALVYRCPENVAPQALIHLRRVDPRRAEFLGEQIRDAIKVAMFRAGGAVN